MKSYFLFSLMILIGAHSSLAGQDRGGGSLVESEFQTISKEIEDNLYSSSIPGFSIEKFRLSVRTAKIQAVEEKLFDRNGELKDALNYPSQNRVEVNIAAWTMASSFYLRAVIVAHEHLGLMGIPDPGYANSRLLLKEAYMDNTEQRFSTGKYGIDLALFVRSQKDFWRKEGLGKRINIDWATMKCIAVSSAADSGTCLVKGDLNAPNSSAVFSLTVFTKLSYKDESKTVNMNLTTLEVEE